MGAPSSTCSRSVFGGLAVASEIRFPVPWGRPLVHFPAFTCARCSGGTAQSGELAGRWSPSQHGPSPGVPGGPALGVRCKR